MAVFAKAGAVVSGVQPKVAVGSITGLVTGLVVWLLMSYVPQFRSGVPEAVVALIPVATAWAGHTFAAYMTPSSSGTPAAPVVVPPSPPKA
jgi:hypothetical protein